MKPFKNNDLTAKTKLFVLGCLAIAMASCASPEERAARKAADTAGKVTVAQANTATDTAAADTSLTTATVPGAEATPAATPAATATTTATPATEKAPATVPAAAQAMPGEALLAKSDCLACHNKTQKIVGPAYVNVAAKYTAADIDMLVDKIIAGGSGAWGSVPMSPHPDLSKTDAKEMVKYILSLKK